MRTRPIQSSSDPVPSGDVHRTVLLHDAIQELAIQLDDVVVDATLGGAGHARAIAGKLDERGMLIGLDLDGEAIVRAKNALALVRPRVELAQANFRSLSAVLNRLGVQTIAKALFDLGWSAYQLRAGRGFSFLRDEPLLMTYADEPNGLTASTIVNQWEESSLADIIFGWGEERYARRIARAIVEARMRAPITSSAALADIVGKAVPRAYAHGRLHPATRTFQAIRIAANDELGALEEGLRAAWEHLAPGGRIAVITFHSIEDRVVKRLFMALEGSGEGKRVHKKPLTPSQEEILGNPRARSAKLRVISKQ